MSVELIFWKNTNLQVGKLLIASRLVLLPQGQNPLHLLKTRSNLAPSPEHMVSQSNSGVPGGDLLVKYGIYAPEITNFEVYLFFGVSPSAECLRLLCLLAPSRSPVFFAASVHRNAPRKRLLYTQFNRLDTFAPELRTNHVRADNASPQRT